MGLWEWSLAAYARPGVAEACLHLQDACGQNVPLLLWAVWAETDDPSLLARAVEAARGWDAAVVAPLRAVRRTLMSSTAVVSPTAREGLRQDVKAAELRAERVLMETLEAMADHKGGAPALAALTAAAAAWTSQVDPAALAALAAAFG